MELIKISERNGNKAVDARELHSFLGSKKDFSDWIKHRINKYGLTDGVDYSKLPQTGEAKNQSVRIDYALTLDAAKELSMVEGNAKGKQARQYFIEQDKKVLSGVVKLPTMKEMALAVVRVEEEKERLQIVNDLQAAELKESAPFVSYAKEVLTSDSTYNTNLIAKELGMSAISLNQILHSKGIQYKQGSTWILYFKYQDAGYTKTKTTTYTGANGETKTSMLTVWTELGRKFIHELMKQSLSVA